MSGVTPLWRRSGLWPAGTAWSPIRGVVGPGAVDVAGNQAGVDAYYVLGRPMVRWIGAAPGTAHWWCGHPSSSRIDSREPRLVSIPRPGRASAVRGEGEIAAAAPQLVLP